MWPPTGARVTVGRSRERSPLSYWRAFVSLASRRPRYSKSLIRSRSCTSIVPQGRIGPLSFLIGAFLLLGGRSAPHPVAPEWLLPPQPEDLPKVNNLICTTHDHPQEGKMFHLAQSVPAEAGPGRCRLRGRPATAP